MSRLDELAELLLDVVPLLDELLLDVVPLLDELQPVLLWSPASSFRIDAYLCLVIGGY